MLSLAMTLSVFGARAMAQYPSGYENFGASSFPVQASGTMQNVPQVPKYAFNAHQPSSYGITGPAPNGQYQMVGTQGGVYGSTHGAAVQHSPLPMATQMPAAPMQTHMAAPVQQHVSPTPLVHNAAPMVAGSAGCSSCATPTAPMMDYGYAQSIAPNCTSCGPAPVSYGYTASPSCGVVAPAPNRISKPWFFGANALLFNRVDHKNIPLSFNDAAYAPDILTTRDARQRVAGGFETTIGRYFNCGRNAVALTYWGVFPSDQEVTRANATAGVYRSRIPFEYMEMAGTPAAPTTPYPVYDWYDAAFTHTLQRSFEYHNVEFNLIGFAAGGAARNFNMSTAGSLFSGTRHAGSAGCGYCGGAGCGSCSSSCSPCATSCNTCAPTKYATGPCCLTPPRCGSRLNLSWFLGLRYFRFADNLLYAASLADTVINRAADDLYYEVNTTNDLVGFQAGGRFDWCVASRLNLYGLTKVGIYNNRSTMFTRLGTDFDYAYLNDTRTPTNPNNNVDYLFDESKDNVAFLSEIGAGLGYRVSCKWTATFGYRAVIASGVATAPDNVRQTFANYDDVRDFDNYGTLILHGFNFGAIYNY
ncbi:MAG: BBP7 family outer membrane beta-barrel protein, partial [Planctomycetota bacterium]